ncbi:DNA polymerase [Venustampulla echinocandica]|uniref:DNA polymerase n=1 Tax=Venustampulla echinocandica TaxID=2656787 RepID=A0A370TUP0_9HELO|nr:DNA polymerase [Venustampulla echinocandica]RDL39262.1 DNA polymerase [Venustampulla echinocandica]
MISTAAAAVAARPRIQTRNDNRIVLHFDYDCFYASVFERENPSLKALPLLTPPPKAVQQKQIVVTCNYEARRRGLRKLQLISEAKKLVPDVVIVLGEELGRFRDASKALYKFLEAFTWSGKVEKLGFDEVWMDVTDLIDYNQAILNTNDLEHSFFQLKRNDPTVGFSYDATKIAGHSFPDNPQQGIPSRSCTVTPPLGREDNDTVTLMTRLILGSHLAHHLRLNLEDDQGYTSTVGISTNKLLSKLVGNLNKPKGQTTLLPPYVILEDASCLSSSDEARRQSHVSLFLDGHDIGKIPGIGFKMSQRIRNHVLSRPADFDDRSMYEGTNESITVGHVATFPGMGPELLEKILGVPGAERGIGGRAWNLINGIDDTEVQQAKNVPSQISIEDSYGRLETMSEVVKELRTLTTSLIRRMHRDLLEDDDEPDSAGGKRWTAHPKTLRLSTRPRLPLNADGTRTRSFNRISRSGPLPNFVFNLKEDINAIVEKLVQVALIPMFRRLHSQPSGWSLSLLNVAVTNMVETASDDGRAGGRRDIGRMFKRQEEVLKEWKVEDRDVPPDHPAGSEAVVPSHAIPLPPTLGNEIQHHCVPTALAGSEDMIQPTQTSTDGNASWESDDEDDGAGNRAMCAVCNAVMPAFAMAAHERFHDLDK